MKLTVRRVITAAMVGGSLIAGGVVGATFFGSGTLTPITLAASNTTPSPSPGVFKSNEAATHESGETAAHEADENSGKAGFGHGPGPGGSNENATHESGETAAHEAAEGTGPAPTGTAPAPTN